jgi:hypothetical protein
MHEKWHGRYATAYLAIALIGKRSLVRTSRTGIIAHVESQGTAAMFSVTLSMEPQFPNDVMQ